MSHFDFDVGIISGGPAGIATAVYLVKIGLSYVVFERELFRSFAGRRAFSS